ncbi:DUF4347 domain-containing protein [Nostoc sp. ChiVER01]|uniref:DUF4347 domain-containing protein n=1 Tax=Nostoc sp. ChiVER01 TaxID=3075382 RepID=UPI002AD484EE|nr:DUF4347 domain-containing protein [Nostoc sp. ChiVER01]MDZ8226250.1 DUF4347 domain-containing protein [Nostoc sp. ChiVER01]
MSLNPIISSASTFTYTDSSTVQILFIDTLVSNAEILLKGTFPSVETVILSAQRDGVEQITEALKQRQNIKTVHIVSHGAPGCLYLGNSQLSLDTLKDYVPQLQGCSRENLNLLLYGCNVAAGDAGEEFLYKLHSLMGAKIAASASKTGNTELGGNWDLEVTMGEIKPQLAFSDQAIANYPGILGSTVPFDVASVFDADVIVNRTGGVTDTIQTAIDGKNFALITQSFATFTNSTLGNGLPDDGFFGATSFNPDIQLSYRNSENGNNARLITTSTGNFTFNVSSGQYAYVHLALTSTEASSNVRLTLNYSDGTTQTTDSQTIPDWFNEITPSTTLYYLIDGLDRSKADGTGFENANDPAIFGVRVSADATKTLESITLEKTASTGYLAFLGATGELNTPPTLQTAIADQTAEEDTAFSFTFDADTFSDADTEDILTYTATLENDDSLPTWLNFNPTTNTFSGTPTNQDVGTLNIKVTATDSAEAIATDVFTLTTVAQETPTIPTVDSTLLINTTGDIFSVNTNANNEDEDDQGKLSIKIKNNTSDKVNELNVFTVDDEEGRINGIAPGAEGYTQAALSRSKVVFSTLANLPNGFNPTDLINILEFDSNTKLRFYLVSDSTTQAILSGKTSLSNVSFSSTITNNTEQEKGFSVNFQNLVVDIQPTNEETSLGTGLQGKYQGELIDLDSVTEPVKAEFIVNREAIYNNYVGFYKIADENGGIDTNSDGKADILVGQTGYTEAAVARRVVGIDLTVNNQAKVNYTGTFETDSLFAPFIIVNGKPDAIQNGNANLDVYFSFLGANSDKVDHIRLLGNNSFGFEDLANGGDKDYNDMIVQVKLTNNIG